MTSNDRLDFQKGLTKQNLNEPCIVLYNSSAKDANATVVKRRDVDLEFIIESKGYYLVTKNLKEAYYLTAILNSSVPNLLMKDFQTKGLFGARDVHKRILDVYWPKFDSEDEMHSQLADWSECAHKSVSNFLKNIEPHREIDGIYLGQIRLDIKAHLNKELKEIDMLVQSIIR